MKYFLIISIILFGSCKKEIAKKSIIDRSTDSIEILDAYRISVGGRPSYDSVICRFNQITIAASWKVYLGYDTQSSPYWTSGINKLTNGTSTNETFNCGFGYSIATNRPNDIHFVVYYSDVDSLVAKPLNITKFINR